MRRHNNQYTHAKRPVRRAVNSDCVALVLADGSLRRKKERAKYQRVATQLERDTHKLKVFEEHDAPQFAQWMEQEFAELLLPLRQAMVRLAELEQLEHQVRTLASLRRMPLWRAYQEVEAARSAGTIDQLFGIGDENAGEAEPDPFRDPGGRDEDTDEDAAAYQAFRDFAREMFGIEFDDDDADDAHSTHTHDDHSKWSSRQSTHTRPAEREGDAYLKGLYRQLVRVLHPDAGAAMTPERQRQWSEVQDAYSWGDVHRLMRLHDEICGGDTTAGVKLDFGVMPIGDIIALRKPIDQRLRQVRARLREAKSQPCWGFGVAVKEQGRKLSALRSSLQRELRSDLTHATAAKHELERMVATWARGPKTTASRASRAGKAPPRSRSAPSNRYSESW